MEPRPHKTAGAIDRSQASRSVLYASTAGGWSAATEGAVRDLAGRVELLVAATARNSQGEAYADMLRQIVGREDCGFQRLRPQHDDWNDDLKEREGDKRASRIGVRHIKGKALPADAGLEPANAQAAAAEG